VPDSSWLSDPGSVKAKDATDAKDLLGGPWHTLRNINAIRS